MSQKGGLIMVLNKPWKDQKHPMKEFKSPFKDVDGNPWAFTINVGTYWGCISCPDEFLVNEVSKPSDGLCLDCRAKLCDGDVAKS